MGTEFIAKTRKSSKKYLDRKQAKLRAPTLFDADPQTAARSYVANTEQGSSVYPGDAIQLETEGSAVVLRRGGQIIGRNNRPHPGLQRTVRSAGGYFPASVLSINPISSTIEFRISSSGEGAR